VALEFALIAPLLILMLLEIADLGLALISRERLLSAVAAGAHYAALKGQNLSQASAATTLMSEVATVVTKAGPLTTIVPQVRYNNGLDSSNFAACYCLSGTTPTYSAATCGSACSSDGPTAGKYLAISATVTYTPLFSLNQALIPSPQSATALVRLQ